MSEMVDIVGSFTSEEDCCTGIQAVYRAGLGRPRIFSPIPSEHILRTLGTAKSPVRWCVYVGAWSGAISGFALTIGLSLTWPHIVGGKPYISIPPFTIIGFELMILFGGITAVLSFLGFAILPLFLPTVKVEPAFESKFSSDKFGVAIRCGEGEQGRAEAVLKEAGAEEVRSEPVQG